MSNVVQTVLGTILPDLLGRTLTHEHLGLDFTTFYCSPPEEYEEIMNQRLTLENLGYVHQYPYSSLDNLRFNDERTFEAVAKDLELYKKWGGGALVDNSCHGLQRNLDKLVDLAHRSKVHIIAGTGHYVEKCQTDNKHTNMTLEQMTDLYSKELITGIEVDHIGMVKCGFIGEVGSGYPLSDFEKQAIKATGEIQEVIGCGVSFHPGRNSKAPYEIMRLYLEAGGKANKCVMSHLERTIMDIDSLLEFAKFGSFLQFDLFGIECSLYQLNPNIEMPSDGQRLEKLMKLMVEGLTDRVLLSHDIHTKHRLTSFGGHGFHHIHLNVLPRLFARGVTLEQVDQITVRNPANWLKFKI